ncbi:hypothetical protein D3C73_1465620 [compost metagenome]
MRQQYPDGQHRAAKEGGTPAEQVTNQGPGGDAAYGTHRNTAEDQRGGASLAGFRHQMAAIVGGESPKAADADTQ